MNNELENDIKSLLIPKIDRDRKQVALFLPPYKIEKLDELVRELAEYSNGKVNRNVLIEKAIDNLIKTIPKVISQYEKSEEESNVNFDTVVCSSLPSGLDFIERYDRWEYVKLDSKKIKYIKYVALYVGAPYSEIKMYMEVDKFEEVIMHDKQKRYRIYLKKPYHYIRPGIKLGNTSSVTARGIKYTTLEKILNAKEYSDILL